MSKVAGVTDDELDGLSDEERAAISGDDDDSGEDLSAIADDDGDAAGDEANDAGKDADDDAADAVDDEADGDAAQADANAAKDAKGDDTQGGAGANDKAGAQEAVEFSVPAASMPRFNVSPVDDYEGQISAININLAELTASFRAGEIELDEFQSKQSEVQGRRDELLSQKIQAEMGEKFNAQAAQTEWAMQCGYFMRTVQKLDGIDYVKGVVKVDGKDVPLQGELDKMLKVLGNMPENADKNGEWFLREADTIVRARYGLASKRTSGGQPKPDAAKIAARKPNLKSVPKTLGGLPSAAGGDASDEAESGEFAALDKLTGMELENAVARMTPEQQRRYAEAA